jgi:hypothetical protein
MRVNLNLPGLPLKLEVTLPPLPTMRIPKHLLIKTLAVVGLISFTAIFAGGLGVLLVIYIHDIVGN